jgi:hypothetical protein
MLGEDGPHLLLSTSDWSRLIGTGAGTGLASLTTERVVAGGAILR